MHGYPHTSTLAKCRKTHGGCRRCRVIATLAKERVLPPFNSFFSSLCSPWAAFSSCLANRLRNLKRDAAIEMDCGVFAFGFGYLENRQLPVASPPIQFYISYTYIYQFIAFFEGVAASCVYLACQWV